ncbi:MAG: phosphatidate cytidylyltransferase [Anaerolineae bacterium]|nr:phosphatidate cytidylyltransferase [Anaerolineae bacterium]
MLLTRVMTAAVALPIVAVAAWLGHPWLTALVTLALGAGAYEFARLGLRAGHQVPPPLCAAAAAVLALEAGATHGRFRPALLAALLLGWAIWYVFHAHSPTRTEAWAFSALSSFYVGYLGSHLVSLRLLPHGLSWLVLAVVTVWVSDTGAYLGGRQWGRAKLAPHLSPNKTWVGALVGLLSALLGGAALAWAGGLAVRHGLAIGLLVGVVCPFGDLIISMVKRQVGVKDSGSLFPGHGGMLDRLDTLLFVGPLAYYYATLAAGAA